MIWNHKWRDYGLQKVKVTDTRHYTESERFNIKLQVANYWLLEMKSLKYFVEFLCEFFKIQHCCKQFKLALNSNTRDRQVLKVQLQDDYKETPPSRNVLSPSLNDASNHITIPGWSGNKTKIRSSIDSDCGWVLQNTTTMYLNLFF